MKCTKRNSWCLIVLKRAALQTRLVEMGKWSWEQKPELRLLRLLSEVNSLVTVPDVHFPPPFSWTFSPLLYFTKLLEFSRVSQLHLEIEHAPWQYGHPCGRVKASTGREPRTWLLCALCKYSGQWALEVSILYGAASLFLTGHWIKIAVAAVCYLERVCLSCGSVFHTWIFVI